MPEPLNNEVIYKLQPNRTMHLRGFDAFGAAAAMHSATTDSFIVSGVFRDAADFAVLIAFDADNFYEHASLKYLPNFSFDGLTLSFDVKYTGLRPLDSLRFATIDWPFLDVIREDNSTARIRLSEHATLASGSYTKASASFTITDAGLKQYDRVTLWYQNFAFDYLVPAVECAYEFVGGATGDTHSLTIASTVYSHIQTTTDTNTSIAEAIRDLVNTSTLVQAETDPANVVIVRAKADTGAAIAVASSASAATYMIFAIGKQAIAANLAAQINSVDWTGLEIALPLEATATNGIVTIRCAKPGIDGNAITMYSVGKNARLTAQSLLAPFETNCWHAPFTGGSSDVTWSITLNFTALGLMAIRQMWFTFAPPLADGANFTSTDWKAEFSNWHLTGPAAQRELKVAGSDSVRVEENSSWCKYTGQWQQTVGFYSGGLCQRGSTAGDKVEIFYSCAVTHDLYLGTTLFADRATIGARLDDDTRSTHNLAVSADAPIYARRKLRSNVPPGRHNVTIDLVNNGVFDFDFLEAASPANIPAPLPARDHASPALDYSTDHTYKLPPSRIHWIFDQLGFTGPMNEYLGVFWWNERHRMGAVIPAATLILTGTFTPGDQIVALIGGTPVGKTVFPNETNTVIARHLACFINETLVGVWASASGATLTIATRSPNPAYNFTLSTDVQSTTGNATISGSLSGGHPGLWEIDLSAANPLNRAARDWHTDFFAQAASRNREAVIACSMELVNPPSGFAARYPDNTPVITDVGFASLSSTHCAFNTNMLALQKKVYLALANLQSAAGLIPTLQFGEFLWWFFTNQTLANPQGGMAFYDSETAAQALAALGRPLHIFRKPTDSPHVNSNADAQFLRNKIRDHIASLRSHVLTTHSNARFELLYPYDVNHPTPAGVHSLGGALNRFINFPVEFESKQTSGLDTLKMEALDFGAWSRNLDLSRTAIEFPLQLGWPKDSVRYLVPVFRAGGAWEKEYLEAKGQGIPVINFWAHDHVNLFNLNCHEPERASTVGLFG